LQRDLLPKQRRAARRFIEARVKVILRSGLGIRGSESLQRWRFSGRRRQGDGIERCRGVERHHQLERVAVWGSADTVERRFEARSRLHGPTR
jgi:hypothetical protein